MKRVKTIYGIVLASGNLPSVSFQTVQFIESADGKKLPAAARHHFRVLYQQPGKISFVSNRILNLPAGGKIQLEPDVRSSVQGWTTLPIQIPSNRSYVTPSRLTGCAFPSASQPTSLRAIIQQTTPVTRDPATQRSDDDFPADFPIRYTIIRINRELKKGNLLTNGSLQSGQSRSTILAQQGNELIIEGHPQLSTSAECTIQLPLHSTASGPRLAVLSIDNMTSPEQKKGGEFLFRCSVKEKVTITKGGRSAEQVRTRTKPVIARLLSDINATGASSLQCLVEIAGAFPEFSLPPQGTALLYFQPYSVELTASAAFPGQPGEALRHSYYTAETRDGAGIKSSLSAIAHLMLPNTAALQKPAPPFPAGNAQARESWVSLPDAHGNSTANIQWNSAGSGLRYELSRASDQAIVMAHRALWHQGLPFSSDQNGKELITNFRVSGSAPLFSLTCSWPAGSDPGRFKGGRFLQSNVAQAPAKRSFEVVGIEQQGTNVTFLLRATINGVAPASGNSGVFHILPDYASILNNESQLRALADQSDAGTPEGLNAFSLITPQPLRGIQTFLDQAAGLGTNRYYYKLRTVNTAENRSPWSNASVPFHQLDTRKPAAPARQTSGAFCINNKVLLFWKKAESDIGSYIIRRKESGSSASPVEYRLTTAQLQAKPLMSREAQFLRLEQRLAFPITDRAAADQLIRTSFFVDLLKPSGPVRIPAHEYEVQYQFEPVSRQLLISGVNFLQKRDGGNKYRITCNNVQLTQENAFHHFIDEQGLIEGKQYEYELVAVRTPGPPGLYRIMSEKAQLPPLKMISYVAPATPVVELQIINPNNTPGLSTVRTALLRISQLQPGTQLRIQKYRSADRTVSLRPELVTIVNNKPRFLEDGKLLVTAENTQPEIRDMEMLATESRIYVVQAISSAGIASDEIIQNYQP